MNIRLVIASVSSYVGSLNGEHWYGTIRPASEDGPEIRLKRKIADKKEADYLNGKDSCEGSFKWKVGDDTDRFATRKEVEEAAKREWRKHFPDHDGLVAGTFSTADPMQPLDGKPLVLRKLKSFWKRAQATGGYEKNDRAMTKVSDEYWAWVCGKEKSEA